MRWLLAIAVVAATAAGACALLDDGPPDDHCTTNEDCFRAQGEICNLDKHICELRMDAGIDAP